MAKNEILKSEWKEYLFGELLEEVKIKNKDNYAYPVLSVTQGKGVILQSDKYKKEIASEDKSGYKCVPKKSVVFNPNYLNFGAIGVQEVVEMGLVSSIYGVFKIINEDILDYEFLKHLIRSKLLIKEYNKFANGSSAIVLTGELHGMHVRLSVSIQDFKKVWVLLPSLLEQKKIAEILSKLDCKINNIESILVKTNELKKGLMQQLLTKGIGHTEYKQTELGEIPLSWECKKFDEVMVLQRGFDLPSQNRQEGDVPILSANGISGYHNEAKVKGPGIITGRSGTIGKVHYIEKDFWALNTSLYVKEMFNNNPKFLFYFLSNFGIEKYSTGTGVPTLNRNDVHKVLIAVPSSIEEQQKIAQILSTVDEQLEIYEQEKAKYEELKKGLMQQLLTGQIRVKI